MFVEPEGLYTNEMYLGGMSSSLPEDVQYAMYRTVPGLENVKIVRNAYAIEYDCINPRQLDASLEFKAISGLFSGGQFNGSSGYEEAAAQGLVAGINAALKIKGEKPLVLDRADGYIGTLIDDLVTRGTNEPYRMMTSRSEYRLLLRQEHERRYQRLFLMTAELKNELYFLKKNSDDIEQVMTNAYRLYERLGEKEGESGELSALALSIARDVHEVKKDNLRIIRGIEGEVEEVYDQEQMEFQDLMHILENSTRRMLGENRASIRLECRRTADFSTQEHYRLLSILKNLVTNAIEAIQGAGGRGIVLVEERVEGDTLFLTVSDDGPGISERSMHNLFQVGYSTKFDPETGNINRGVGLPAVKSLTEELGGSVSVESQPGRGARFSVELPLHRVKGEKREK